MTIFLLFRLLMVLLVLGDYLGGAFIMVRVRPSFRRFTAATLAIQSVDDHQGMMTEATLRCLTFSNLPRDQEPDLLCDLLMEVGACSASIVDADRGTEHEQPLFGEPTITGTIISNDPALPDGGVQRAAVPPVVWNRCNVIAHFPASTDIPRTIELVRDTLQMPALLLLQNNYTVEQVPNKDWVVHVQQSWKPIVVANKYVLRFPWHSDEDVADAIIVAEEATTTTTTKQDGDLLELRLQGGIAFGTGEHPTTQLCLEWLHDVVTAQVRRREQSEESSSSSSSTIIHVLDYGSGSGILGMGACALSSSRVKAVGIDIDVDACRIANANAQVNGLSMRSYLPPLSETIDAESKSLLFKAHAYAQSQLGIVERGEQQPGDDLILPDTDDYRINYDVCVANILAGPLVTLAPTLASMMKPGAALGMSGILSHQSDMIVEAYQAAGFENVRVAKELGGWILVTANNNSSNNNNNNNNNKRGGPTN